MEIRIFRRAFIFNLAGVLLYVFCTLHPAYGGVYRWNSVGPDGGAGRYLVISPSDPEVLYFLAVDHYLFRSGDGGDIWKIQNAGAPILGRDDVARALIVDPTNANTLYLASGAPSIRKSRDGGRSWQRYDDGLENERLGTLAIDPNNPSTLYGGLSSGLVKSTDGGEHWIRINGGLERVSVLVVDPQDPVVLYATTDNGVFKSGNQGADWVRLVDVADFGESSLAVSVVVDPVRTGVVYAIIQSNHAPATMNMIKSTDGGRHWEAIFPADHPESNDFCTSPRSITIDPVNTERLYAVSPRFSFFLSTDDFYGEGGCVWQSEDGGQTWRILYHGGDEFGHESAVSIVINPLDPRKLYFQVGTGVLMSIDSGAHWETANSGIHAQRFIFSLAIDPMDSSIMYADGWKTEDGGEHWRWLPHGRGLIAIDPENSSMLYKVKDRSVFKSADGGLSWVHLTDNFLVEPCPAFSWDCSDRLSSIVIHRKDRRVIYVGGVGGVIKSADGGMSWQAANAGLPEVRALALHPNDPDVIYAVGPRSTPGVTLSDAVIKSTDGGQNWRVLTNGLASPDENDQYLNIFTIALDSTDPETLYLGTSNGVYNSRDAGEHWEAVNEGLPYIAEAAAYASVMSVAIDPNNPGVVYVGTTNFYEGTTGNSIFRSRNGGQHWTNIDSGLATDAGILVIKVAPDTGQLYAVVSDRGVLKYEETALLTGVSGRGFVGSGHEVLILGFTIPGDKPMEVTIIGYGPWLADWNLSNVLADPELMVFSGRTPIAHNDNWEESDVINIIAKSRLPPASHLEPALALTLPPGNYTAHLPSVSSIS